MLGSVVSLASYCVSFFLPISTCHAEAWNKDKSNYPMTTSAYENPSQSLEGTPLTMDQIYQLVLQKPVNLTSSVRLRVNQLYKIEEDIIKSILPTADELVGFCGLLKPIPFSAPSSPRTLFNWNFFQHFHRKDEDNDDPSQITTGEIVPNYTPTTTTKKYNPYTTTPNKYEPQSTHYTTTTKKYQPYNTKYAMTTQKYEHSAAPYTTYKNNCESKMDDKMATVIIGGCDYENVVPTNEIWSVMSYYHQIPKSPFTSCQKPSSVFFNNSIVTCGEGKYHKMACYQYSFQQTSYDKKWQPFPTPPDYREKFTMTALDSGIAIVGGLHSSNQVLFYKDGYWTPAMEFEGFKDLYHHCAVRYDNEKVMVIGGFQDHLPSSKVYIIDFAYSSIKEVASLQEKRYSHSCTPAVLDGRNVIVTAGGFNDYEVTNSVEVYDLCKNDYKWTSLPPMNIKRYHFGLTLMGDRIGAFGGQPTIESENIEVYNSKTYEWEFLGQKMQHPKRHYFSAVSVPESVFHSEPAYPNKPSYGAPYLAPYDRVSTRYAQK